MFKLIFQFSKLLRINIVRKTAQFKIISETNFRRHTKPVILGFLPLVSLIECKHLVMNDGCSYVVKQAVNNMDTKDIKKLLQDGEYLIHKQHQYDKGEQLLLQALHQAIEEKKTEFISRIQDTLANLYLHQKKYENAEKLFINILQQLFATGSTKTDPEVIEISLKLSVLYAQQDKQELAINGFTWTLVQCRSIVDNKERRPLAEQRNNMALLGMILDSYGRYLYAKNDNKNALKCTLEAAEISKKLYGDTDRRTLVLYNDVASMCGSLGHKADSLKHVSNIISHCEAATPPIPSSDEAVFYANYSIILSLNGQDDKAVDALKKALVAASATNDKQLKQYIGSLASKISSK